MQEVNFNLGGNTGSVNMNDLQNQANQNLGNAQALANQAAGAAAAGAAAAGAAAAGMAAGLGGAAEEAIKMGLATQFSDADEAYDLIKDIIEDCKVDIDCYKKGSQWSTVYISNGIILIFICVSNICVAVGAYNHLCRAIGAICGCCLCITHFALIVTAGVFRFSNFGKLASLHLGPTYVPSTNILDVSDDWTYEKDGQLILALFILQLLGMMLCCFAACWPMYAK